MCPEAASRSIQLFSTLIIEKKNGINPLSVPVNQFQKHLALGTELILMFEIVKQALNSILPIFLKLLKIPFLEFFLY